MNPPFTKYNIKEGQTDFDFVCGLPNPEDYGISPLPSWNTTLWLVEKTNKGFKLKFGTPCPKGGGALYLTIHTPQKFEELQRIRTIKSTYREPKTKIPKDVEIV